MMNHLEDFWQSPAVQAAVQAGAFIMDPPEEYRPAVNLGKKYLIPIAQKAAKQWARESGIPTVKRAGEWFVDAGKHGLIKLWKAHKWAVSGALMGPIQMGIKAGLVTDPLGPGTTVPQLTQREKAALNFVQASNEHRRRRLQTRFRVVQPGRSYAKRTYRRGTGRRTFGRFRRYSRYRRRSANYPRRRTYYRRRRWY